MKRWMIAIVMMLFGVSAMLVACNSGGGGDDDDDDCDANDVHGSYPVKITWDEETCEEELVGQFVTGTTEIEQDKNVANVFFKEFGSGTEREKVFTGTVCEYTISKSEEKNVPFGDDVDCVQHRQTTYTLQLDPETQNISGEFTGTYMWQGAECKDYGITPNEQCSWKKVIEPY